jgi:hypothetical protein
MALGRRVQGHGCSHWVQDRGSPGEVVPPSALPFCLRAFYLERSNLPTDASTTVVKIDQVCPPPPEVGACGALESGLTSSQNPGPEALVATAVSPPGRLWAISLSLEDSFGGLFSGTLCQGCSLSVPFVSNLLPTFRNQRFPHELSAVAHVCNPCHMGDRGRRIKV